MPKVQIELPEDIYKKLKQAAKEHYTSLRGYIADHMTQFITSPEKFISTPDNLPDGTTTTVKLKAQRPKTPEEIEEEQIATFQKRAKQILGHEFESMVEVSLDPTNTYYDFAEKQEGKFVRYAYTMPEHKQREYLEEWKKYE